MNTSQSNRLVTVAIRQDPLSCKVGEHLKLCPFLGGQSHSTCQSRGPYLEAERKTNWRCHPSLLSHRRKRSLSQGLA